MLDFVVLPRNTWPVSKPARKNTAYLIPDDWDDWFKFETRHSLWYADAAGTLHDIGTVKIGRFGMPKGQRSPDLPNTFRTLPDVFSLGQDPSYYEELGSISARAREDILEGLGDIAYNPELYGRAVDEEVTGISLMRFVSPATVEGQFRRLIAGGRRNERFEFEYEYPAASSVGQRVPVLTFTVKPGSIPPTNVHAIIGRNGVGKTFLLENLAKSLVTSRGEHDENHGEVRMSSGSTLFAGLTSVTFSAFDAFEPFPQTRNRSSGLSYTYIGLKSQKRTSDGDAFVPKAPSTLAREFGNSVKSCLLEEKLPRWRAALLTLASDPIFSSAGVDALANEADLDSVPRAARELYRRLSSGHKIVLLTITRLVEVVEERSLVLLDEPEAHLHPPLLSAFVRALSDLMTEQNGVAILTTHSPVVLQELPRDNAWIINRRGRAVNVDRPEIETFGENVGVLTHEVFGLEVTNSGFHDLVRREVDRSESLNEVLETFGEQLGSEAGAIARALMFAKERASRRQDAR